MITLLSYAILLITNHIVLATDISRDDELALELDDLDFPDSFFSGHKLPAPGSNHENVDKI